jgi:hypothetical protein
LENSSFYGSQGTSVHLFNLKVCALDQIWCISSMPFSLPIK